MQEFRKTVIIITGPTASGKTGLALKVAEHFGTAIISADSRQCYRELNIGVAKPTAEELVRIPHYFIDSHSIFEQVTAETFERYALAATEGIFRENDFAVMAGGTGLYIKAFCEGMDLIPAVDEKIRQEIREQYQARGLSWLQLEVSTKDPAFWQTAEQQNPQRLMRALEVMNALGKSISSFRTGVKKARNFNIVKIGLEPPKAILHHYINTRTDEMIRAGLVEEAKSLLPYKDLNALQTVGYKELFEHFENRLSLPAAISMIKQNTRRYAKRQMTWLKKDPSIYWFDAANFSSVMSLVNQVLLK